MYKLKDKLRHFWKKVRKEPLFYRHYSFFESYDNHRSEKEANDPDTYLSVNVLFYYRWNVWLEELVHESVQQSWTATQFSLWAVMNLKGHTWQNSTGPTLDMTQVRGEESLISLFFLSVILQNAPVLWWLSKELNLNSIKLYNYVTIWWQLLTDPLLWSNNDDYNNNDS